MKEINIEKYTLWIREKKSFSLIKDDLISNGFTPDEAKEILTRIDEHVVVLQQSRLNKSQGTQLMVSGIILTCLSVIVFLLAPLPLTFLAYGGVVSGIGMIVLGRRKLTQIEYSNSDKRTRYFKRRTSLKD